MKNGTFKFINGDMSSLQQKLNNMRHHHHVTIVHIQHGNNETRILLELFKLENCNEPA